MNCREFRRKHDAYVDDTLSGVDLDGMTRHLRFCERCAQLDTRVRRALLLAHNLPMIYPSAAFTERLQARLVEERALMLAGRAMEDARANGWWRPFTAGGYAVLAAGILTAAGIMVVAAAGHEQQAIRMAPVVASLPEADASPLATPAMVASMQAGISVWPAVFVAQQAPYHFASDAAGR
jgi:anti-sigma-K factor RskA